MKKSGEWKGNLRSAQKIFRVMKMMCFLMFVLLVQVRGDVIAQNQVVSVDMKNCSVEEFLREIKEQTAVSYTHLDVYKRQVFDKLRSENVPFLSNSLQATRYPESSGATVLCSR